MVVEVWSWDGEVYVVELTFNDKIIGTYGPLKQEPYPVELEAFRNNPGIWNVDSKDSLRLEYFRGEFEKKRVIH